MIHTYKNTDKILDNLLEGCQIINYDWRYIYVNDACEKQANRTKEELLGNTMMECYPGIETTPLFETLKHSMEKRVPSQMQNEFVFPDGHSGWFELRVEPVPEGIFILSINITDSKNTQNELENQVKNLKALREIDMTILNSTDLKLALKTVLREMSTLLKIDACEILLLNHHTLSLEPIVHCGFLTRENKHTQIKLGEGHIGRAALEQTPRYFHDIKEAFSTNENNYLNPSLIAKENFKSYYILPLVGKGKTIGVLAILLKNRGVHGSSWFDFLETIAGQAAIAIENNKLFSELQSANIDLLLAYDTTIEGWSRALDIRDKETEGHTIRVTELTLNLAQKMGIGKDELVHIKRGALLHDIGKMGIPDSILLKPSKLTKDEWIIMKKHPVFAYELLSPIKYLNRAIEIPYCHHEKWNGSGYPRNLKGDQIPISAQIFAIVDVWDALRSDRPYRPQWPTKKVIEYIKSQTGSHFNPEIGELFIKAGEEDFFKTSS